MQGSIARIIRYFDQDRVSFKHEPHRVHVPLFDRLEYIFALGQCDHCDRYQDHQYNCNEEHDFDTLHGLYSL